MLVHLGRGTTVAARDIIALAGLAPPLPEDTERLLSRLRACGAVRTLGEEPKTLVLCRRGGARGAEEVCYLSCVGLRTLRERAGYAYR